MGCLTSLDSNHDPARKELDLRRGMPADESSSNRNPASPTGLAITHKRGLPKAEHHARMVRTSRLLGKGGPLG